MLVGAICNRDGSRLKTAPTLVRGYRNYSGKLNSTPGIAGADFGAADAAG